MLELLVVWGVSEAVGLVVKQVLAPLVKGALEDYTKDFFKDCIKDFTKILEPKPLQKAVVQALAEFLEQMNQELQDAEVPEEELEQYIKPLQHFINDSEVKKVLSLPFESEIQLLDYSALEKSWNELSDQQLPEGFDWQRVSKRYLRKVNAIRRESSELRAILDSQKLEEISENTEETAKNTRAMAPVVPDFDLSRYRQGLIKAYDELNLDALDTDGYNYGLKLWRMFVPQDVREANDLSPEVYQITEANLKLLQDKNQLEAVGVSLEKVEIYRQYQQQAKRSVLELIEQLTEKYTVILGKPGSGKSTLLRYIALQWARQESTPLSQEELPLLIELRTYINNCKEKRCGNFLEYLHQGTGVSGGLLEQHQLKEWLEHPQRKSLVMFDGLDEVLDTSDRNAVIQDIINFSTTYPNVRILVTSRINGYKIQQLRSAGFNHFMLQDLEFHQIDWFIDEWHKLAFRNKDEAEGQRKRDRLKTSIRTSGAFRELAGNPLLLTMMAILNRKQELPKSRPDLYEDASKIMLQEWDKERGVSQPEKLDPDIFTLKHKQAILRQVAYKIQERESGLTGNLMISGMELQNIITEYLGHVFGKDRQNLSELLMNNLINRNFILCFFGGDSYGFVHRTFLEYFCAWHWAWRFEKEREVELDELKREVFVKYCYDDTWHEVLRLIVGSIAGKFALEIIEELITVEDEQKQAQHLFLAAKCLLDVRNFSREDERLKLEKAAATLHGILEPLAAAETEGVTEGVRTQAIHWKEQIASLVKQP
jgi:predicted NACHT family NTPase